MDFDTIKKNKPQLTDYTYLQKVIETKNSQKPEIIEPTLIEKITKKIKNSIYTFIENNLFSITIAFIIICFLIYRFIIYGIIKKAKPKPTERQCVVTNYIPMDINIPIGTESKKKHKKKYKNELPIIDENATFDDQCNDDNQQLLNITNDRSLTSDTKNLQIINSSPYAPYNLRDSNGFYSWNQNNSFNLLN